MSGAMRMLLSSNGIAFNTAVCAYVAARGGNRDDLQRFMKTLGPMEPGKDALQVWDDLETVWLSISEGNSE